MADLKMTMRVGDQLVNRLGYGAMRITGEGIWGPPADPDGAVAVLRRALELGVNFIDTADSYGPDVSEELIARALAPYPADLMVATKGGLLRDGPGQWRPDGRPEHLREACEGSLRRLGVDRIDLYQLHAPDDRVPYEESVGALAELREEGKIRHVGVSNVSRSQLQAAQEIVEIVSVQNRFSLSDRSSEKVLERCAEQGIGFIPWFPLGAGELTRPGGVLDSIAGAHQASSSQIALAWLLARSEVIIPIPGTTSIEHLEENVAAASIALALSEEEMGELDALA
jgi:pyridoxine 4-dehydrogenase